MVRMTAEQDAEKRAATRRSVRKIGRWAILVLAGIVLGMWLSVSPGGLLGKADSIGCAVCHRIESHSLFIGDRAMPLCARCSGMHLGFAFTIFAFLATRRGRAGGYPPKWMAFVFGFFALGFALDGLNSFFSLLLGRTWLYEPNNALRLISGTLMGLSMASYAYPAFNQSLWSNWGKERALRSGGDLARLLLLAAIVVLAVLSGNPLLLYPLAILSSLTVVVILGGAYTMFALLFLGRESQALTWRRLFFPLVFGFTLALAQITVIILVRWATTGSCSGVAI
jgi:uncharacterized membrane protein